ncbi:CORD and CS domain protein [Lineolata rhizophorae]|uniref:CORD and CS domain protein n=1 Tax=Lineolata rhizophorae TaxID=578093 RepID=A0A6A6PAC4_9PEZI|nr:CORD and CS domain protein [Lineolata rhizophorae]
MAQKCVHKGCGKVFADENEDCFYHPGPPKFHEGQKGWECCKTRVLTFDEFLAIPPCTKGKHSTTDEAPPPVQTTTAPAPENAPQPVPSGAEQALPAPLPRIPQAELPQRGGTAAPPEETEEDEPSLSIPDGQTCRRRGCDAKYTAGSSREEEKCIHHPGQPIFHEGSKGYSCCKRRVLEFDQFMRIEGCKTKDKHLFIGKGKNDGEEELKTVRHDFYQTPSSVIASLYLKKIDKEASTVRFASDTSVELDLKTSDKKRYKATIPLYASIDPDKSSYRIMGTKLEFNFAKADRSSWPVLRADDPITGEIIQMGRAGRAQ